MVLCAIIVCACPYARALRGLLWGIESKHGVRMIGPY